MAELHCDLIEFMSVVGGYADVPPNVVTSDTIRSLYRLGLIGNYRSGPEEGPGGKKAAMRVQPTVSGLQLFGWALDRQGIVLPHEFTSLPDEWDESLPYLESASAPGLPRA